MMQIFCFHFVVLKIDYEYNPWLDSRVPYKKDVLVNSDHWFLRNIAKTTGFAFLKVLNMYEN